MLQKCLNRWQRGTQGKGQTTLQQQTATSSPFAIYLRQPFLHYSRYRKFSTTYRATACYILTLLLHLSWFFIKLQEKSKFVLMETVTEAASSEVSPVCTSLFAISLKTSRQIQSGSVYFQAWLRFKRKCSAVRWRSYIQAARKQQNRAPKVRTAAETSRVISRFNTLGCNNVVAPGL